MASPHVFLVGFSAFKSDCRIRATAFQVSQRVTLKVRLIIWTRIRERLFAGGTLFGGLRRDCLLCQIIAFYVMISNWMLRNFGC